jgi:hypothetical protein
MGQCCSNSLNDQTSELKTLDAAQLHSKFSWRQIQLLIKVQARIRGILARKKVRVMRTYKGSGKGMGGNFGQMISSTGELMQDYNNDKVIVGTLFFFIFCTAN